MPENTTRGGYDRAKTLFISDLDGTLLNKTAELSPRTAATITQLLAEGYNFTLATARAAPSVLQIFKGFELRLPIALLNGVMIYDFATARYLKVEYLQRNDILAIIDAARTNATDVLIYRISETDFNVTRYFATDGNERLTSIFMDDIVDRRRGVDENVYGQSGIAVTDDIAYFTFADTRERLEPIYNLVTQLPGVAVVLSKDDYTADGWFLECFSVNASKANATRWIREKHGFAHVVSFGDNVNDIEFVGQADEGYAPENAIPETKAVARAVIASNADDGVAQWLEVNVLGE